MFDFVETNITDELMYYIRSPWLPHETAESHCAIIYFLQIICLFSAGVVLFLVVWII